jgi:hypothetical protein
MDVVSKIGVTFLFCLQLVNCVVEGSNGQNLTKGIMDTFMVVSGLTKVEVSKKLLCFGANSVSTFQGA